MVGVDPGGPLGVLARQAENWARQNLGEVEFELAEAFLRPRTPRPVDVHAPLPRPRPQSSSPSQPPPAPPPPQAPDPEQIARNFMGFGTNEPLTKQMVNDRRRALASALHPDRRGGDTSAMQRINESADLLLSML